MAASSSSSQASIVDTDSWSEGVVMAIKYQDFGIIALDSRVTRSPLQEVVDNEYNKSLKPYKDFHVYLGFSGSKSCIEDLKEKLPQMCSQYDNPANMEEAMGNILGFVNDNFAVDWHMNNIHVDIIVVGAISLSPPEPFKIYVIKKGAADLYVLEEVERHILCIGDGSEVLNGYMRGLRHNFTAEQASNYAAHGIKLANEEYWSSGGDIRAIQIFRDSSEELVWKQRDPLDAACPYEFSSRRRR